MMQNEIIAVELPTEDNAHATMCPPCAKRKFPNETAMNKLVTLPKGISHCNSCGQSLVDTDETGNPDSPYPPDGPDPRKPTEFYM